MAKVMTEMAIAGRGARGERNSIVLARNEVGTTNCGFIRARAIVIIALPLKPPTSPDNHHAFRPAHPVVRRHEYGCIIDGPARKMVEAEIE